MLYISTMRLRWWLSKHASDHFTWMNHTQSHLKIYMGPTFPHHSFLMLHSKEQSKRRICRVPTSEFTTEGYFSMAFPTLFPADFLGQRFNTEVTIGNYFTHLLKYDDGRFARHPRFRFFAEMRWRAGRIYIQQHPGDAQLTVDEKRRRSFFQQSTPLCIQSSWYQTILVQAAQSCHQYGWHPWTTHHLFHTQCSWSTMARTCSSHLPGRSWLFKK